MSKYSDKKRRQAEAALAEEARQREETSRQRAEAAKRHAEAVARKAVRRRDRLTRPRREVPSSCGDQPLAQLVAKCTVYAKTLVAHGMEECGNTFLELCRRTADTLSFTNANIRKAIKEAIN